MTLRRAGSIRSPLSGGVLGNSRFARPFSPESRWNLPIAQQGSVTTTPTDALSGVNNPALGNWLNTLWTGMYEAKPSDPRVALGFNSQIYANTKRYIDRGNDGVGTQWARYGNDATIEAAILAGSDQLWAGREYNSYSAPEPATYHHRTDTWWDLTPLVPDDALPPPDVDGHLTIFQPNGWALECYSPVRASNGDLFTHFASYTDVNGLGDGSENGRRASMVPNYAGIIRDGEITAGVIPHALALAVGPECLSTDTPLDPAVALDDVTTAYTGSLPMGAWLSLPADLDLGTLHLTSALGMMIAVALQTYGGYVIDQTGALNMLILTQHNARDITSFAFDVWNDLKAITPALQLTARA